MAELEETTEELEKKLAQLATKASSDQTHVFFNRIIRCLGIHKYELDENSNLLLLLETDHDITSEGYRISTGERKFIAFSYFLAEVLASVANREELAEVVVIIDDPVDSSDYDKFYSFVSVIENLEQILRNAFQSNEIAIGQLLLFTHNALLFERLTNTKKFSQYILVAEDSRTVIRKPTKRVSLTTFSSYLKKITRCVKRLEAPKSGDIGNYIRRILEIVASVENIENNKIDHIEGKSKLNALANHMSHESLERILDPLPESSEYVEACIELVELIQERIPYLYRTIKDRYLAGLEISAYRVDYEKKYSRTSSR